MSDESQHVPQLDDEDKRALANQVYATIANPKATSADVLEAFIGHMILTNQYFYTATGELGVHLSAAVTALRERRPITPRRYLGMPKDDSNDQPQAT